MGNTLGGKKTTRIMKINGETFKLTIPVQAGEVTKDYPGFVLLESESVKHFGIRAKPLGDHQQLKAKRLYFLVELPKFPHEEQAPIIRKVRSGIVMSAKDRLDSLVLARRSVSDLSLLRPRSNFSVEDGQEGSSRNGSRRKIKMKLPKADVEKLMRESKNETEAAEKIMQLYLTTCSDDNNVFDHGRVHRMDGAQGRISRERRGGFMPINEGEIQVA